MLNLPIRASSMPLVAACPASADGGAGVQIDTNDPTAVVGSDVHRAIALRLQGKEVPPLSAEVEGLVALGVDWFNNWLRPKYSAEWQFNLSLAHAPLSGSMDAIGISKDGELAIIPDWKNTYREDDHTAQMLSYSYLAVRTFPKLKRVIYIVPLLRLGVAEEPREVTREWVEEWMREFVRNTLEHPEIFRPGEHCTRCKRKVTCPALNEMNRETVSVLADRSFEKMLTRQNLPAIRERVKLLKEAIGMFEGFQRETILQGGPLPLGNGKVLKAINKHIDVIDFVKGFEILTTSFSNAELGKFVTVGKTKMLDVVGDKAAKGMKGKDGGEMMDQLLKAGAVGTKIETAIMEVKE